LEGDVDLWLTINDVRFDFDVFVAPVFVKRGDILHALAKQFVAKLSSREQEPVWLNRDLLKKVIAVDMLVAAKSNRLDLVARASVYVVDQIHIGRLILKIRVYLYVKVTLALKEIDQVSPAFFHKIRVNRTLRKYGDQLFHLPPPQEGKPREFRTRNPHLDDRPWLGVNNNVSMICVGVEMRLVEVHLAGEMVLIG
jgi:hypothetical protein